MDRKLTTPFLAIAFLLSTVAYAQVQQTVANSLVPVASGTWTLIKDNYNVFCAATTTCTATIQAVGSQAGKHVLVGSLQSYSGPSLVSITGFTATGGTQTLCPASACAVRQAANYDVDSAAIISPTVGDTSVSVTLSGAPMFGYEINVREYVWSGSTIAYDTGSTASSAGCTSCASPALTLTGSNDVIMLSMYAQANITAVTGCFNSSASGLSTQFPEAACPNLSSYTAPTWTQASSAPEAITAIALKGS